MKSLVCSPGFSLSCAVRTGQSPDYEREFMGCAAVPSLPPGTLDRCNISSYITAMRTSCRFAVAVHVLAVLAYREGGAATSVFLASSVNTNPVVIRRLLLLLQAGGFIETRKGAGAGSRLSRPPGRITLAEVYQAVETDEPFASHTKRPNQACPVGNCIQAALEKVFASAEAALQQELAKTSLADVLQTVKASCSRSGKGRQ
jgi:Rrf2 family protein